MDYLEQAKSGDKRAIARLITIVENYGEKHKEVYTEIFKTDPKARIIGVTGPPGAGKSTLVDKLVHGLRTRGKKVGVIAIDPTSPFSGGAILGDRVRMSDLATDPGVFIRSMATRGALGGISRSAFAATRVMAYADFDYIFIETVGVGQSEIDISSIADIVLVVAVPGLGDDIQAIKAGLMEIGDVVAINKSDLDGADIAYLQIQKSFEINRVNVPIAKVSAGKKQGIMELLDILDKEYEIYEKSGEIKRRHENSYRYEMISFLNAEILKMVNVYINNHGGISKIAEKYKDAGVDPYSSCREILKNINFKED